MVRLPLGLHHHLLRHAVLLLHHLHVLLLRHLLLLLWLLWLRLLLLLLRLLLRRLLLLRWRLRQLLLRLRLSCRHVRAHRLQRQLLPCLQLTLLLLSEPLHLLLRRGRTRPGH